jgi:tubulin monoglycylase TTLL3/8
MTFHIKTGENDTQFKRFLDEYQRIAREEKHLKNIWILKPGENSNRGNGITVIK